MAYNAEAAAFLFQRAIGLKLAALVLCGLVQACGQLRDACIERNAEITRTTFGVPHITAADYHSLGIGIGYAYAQDNFCATADHLVTVRALRTTYFGPAATINLGQGEMANADSDAFITALMDDRRLQAASTQMSEQTRLLVDGYVRGFNRFLRSEEAQKTRCFNSPWIHEMTVADHRRMIELAMIQSGLLPFAKYWLAAQPPSDETSIPSSQAPPELSRVRRSAPLPQPQHFELGSNAWAFGKMVTANGRGALMANPHFPWHGPNRFWQMHLTVPGELDVMGASLAHFPVVQIGFNHDIAWTHTVSIAKRFAIRELTLDPEDPTVYIVDGGRYRLRSLEISIAGQDASPPGHRTVWFSEYGPLVHMPEIGLGWTSNRAYSLEDPNSGNVGALEVWRKLSAAKNVDEVLAGLSAIRLPWVNTVSTDRFGDVLYADYSVMPDVDIELLAKCAPTPAARAAAARSGWLILDGSRETCRSAGMHKEPRGTAALPALRRSDWVQNANDSYWLSNPDSPIEHATPVAGAIHAPQRFRTRNGITTIREKLGSGRIEAEDLPLLTLSNRNYAAEIVLDDFLQACKFADVAAQRAGCEALRHWDRRNDTTSRGAVLFGAVWSALFRAGARWRAPFSPHDPVNTPRGWQTNDPHVRDQVLKTIGTNVEAMGRLGLASDVAVGAVQVQSTQTGEIPMHGGSDIEGVLNVIHVNRVARKIEFGSSFVMAVGFDDRGPKAYGLLLYGQSSDEDSRFAFDQLQMFSEKNLPRLPFSSTEVAKTALGPPIFISAKELPTETCATSRIAAHYRAP